MRKAVGTFEAIQACHYTDVFLVVCFGKLLPTINNDDMTKFLNDLKKLCITFK